MSVGRTALHAEATRLIAATPQPLRGWYSLRGLGEEVLAPIARVAADDEELTLMMRQAADVARFIAGLPTDDQPRGSRELRRLVEVSCTPPERAWFGAQHSVLGWEPVFIREVPSDGVSKEQRAMIGHWALVESSHLAKPRGIDRANDFTVAFERIAGASLADLPALSPPIALAVLGEARRGLCSLHAAGMTHGSLRPSRIRIAASGRVYLCFGLDAAQPSAVWEQAELARLLLAGPFGDPLLVEVLESRQENALDVAYDRIVELEPPLDFLARSALLEPQPPGTVLAALAPHVSVRDAVDLMTSVLRHVSVDPV